MVLRDPTLVVRSGGGGGNSGANETDLIGVGALGLGNDGSEPSVVHEVGGSTEASRENQIQEKTSTR